MSIELGRIDWFAVDRGFGVIVTPEGKEYFVHQHYVKCDKEALMKLTPVLFLPSYDQKRMRDTAVNVRLVTELQDWTPLFEYIKIIYNHEKGARFGMHETTTRLSLSELIYLVDKSVTILLNTKSDEEIEDQIIRYLNISFSKNEFLNSYRAITEKIRHPLSEERASKTTKRLSEYFYRILSDDVKFDIWKDKYLRSQFYDSIGEEVSKELLLTQIDKIKIEELQAISTLSYGKSFCSKYIQYHFPNIIDRPLHESIELYKITDYLNIEDKKKYSSIFDELISLRIRLQFSNEDIPSGKDLSENIKEVDNHFNSSNNEPITNTSKSKIIDLLNNWYKNNTSINNLAKDYLVETLSKIEPAILERLFSKRDTTQLERLRILKSLNKTHQLEFLKCNATTNGFLDSFQLITDLIKSQNLFDGQHTIQKILGQPVRWTANEHFTMLSDLNTFALNNASEKEKLSLFLENHTTYVPYHFVEHVLDSLYVSDLEKILIVSVDDRNLTRKLLEKKALLSPNKLHDIYSLARRFLNDIEYAHFDQLIFDSVPQSQYYNLWYSGKGKWFPTKHLRTILEDNPTKYHQISEWIKQGTISQTETSSFLLENLMKKETIDERKGLYRQLNHIKCLLSINIENIHQIKAFKSPLFNHLLWVLDIDDTFDFDTYKRYFIFFTPEDQVRLLKKLFFLKASGRFQFDTEMLDEIVRFDADIYKTARRNDPKLEIDISTDVVIQALRSFEVMNFYNVENKLFEIILNHFSKREFDKNIKLEHYFEECLGRLTYKFNFGTNQEKQISIVKYGNDRFYYAISFPYDEELVEEVRNLPGRKWNKDKKHWGVPSRYKNEVIEFAVKHQFFINIDKKIYSNNLHLAEPTRYIHDNDWGNGELNLPNGIIFCEGRIVNRPHFIFNKEYSWCAGEVCFGKCETLHDSHEWEHYTMLDFCNILGINTDEVNRMGDMIPKGHYYHFVALINRFNRLLEQLYCKSCNRILHPSDFGTSHFAAHTLVRFECNNLYCEAQKMEIYLNHCFNKKCNNIIDSRISMKCENGLYICNKCGCCCSNYLFDKRLKNLKITGGYIPKNLLICVKNRLGHIDKGVYFCYKCGKKTDLNEDELKCCSTCNVQYDLKRFKYSTPRFATPYDEHV